MTTSIFNVEYNIPRYNISMPGRQNRAGNGVMTIVPGMSEVFEFHFMNTDGVPLILTPFKIKLIFWEQNYLDHAELSNLNSTLILAKTVEINDPYVGKTTIVLSSDDTHELGKSGLQNLRWALFMINPENDVFPATITRSGQKYGIVQIDHASGLPTKETILYA